MKYMTKNWYDTMQKTDLHLLLKIDERANEFSEDLYQKLYEQEMTPYSKKLLSFEDVGEFIRNSNNSNNDPKEDLEKLCKRLRDTSTSLGTEEYYHQLIENSINNLNKKLPADILNDIKDIRILALNHATKEIYDRIKQFCETNEKFVEKMCREYQKIEDEQFKDNKPSFVLEDFHDSSIKTSEIIDNDLILELDNTGSFTQVTTIVFKNTEIIKQDGNLDKYWWLYNELYKVDNKYEVHILLCDEKNDLKDLILICDDIVLKK